MEAKNIEKWWPVPRGTYDVFLDDIAFYVEVLATVGTVQIETERWKNLPVEKLSELKPIPTEIKLTALRVTSIEAGGTKIAVSSESVMKVGVALNPDPPMAGADSRSGTRKQVPF